MRLICSWLIGLSFIILVLRCLIFWGMRFVIILMIIGGGFDWVCRLVWVSFLLLRRV